MTIVWVLGFYLRTYITLHIYNIYNSDRDTFIIILTFQLFIHYTHTIYIYNKVYM